MQTLLGLIKDLAKGLKRCNAVGHAMGCKLV